MKLKKKNCELRLTDLVPEEDIQTQLQLKVTSEKAAGPGLRPIYPVPDKVLYVNTLPLSFSPTSSNSSVALFVLLCFSNILD